MSMLALVMIVRDEARCIARCLQSAQPLVDEMVVVDTGSADDTARIAREAGARVHHVVWNDDFAAARNAALDHSQAQWNLVLDADEWIDAGADFAALRAQLAAAAPFLGLVPVASEFALQGSVERAVSWIPRLLPRGVRYQGRIHEQPASELPRRQLPLPVVHDGYLQHHLEQKKGRNEALLLRALADAPGDAYLLYQLGKNYEVYGEYARAVGPCTQALALAGAGASFRHDLVVRTIFSLKKAQQHEAAIELAQAEMPNWQHSPDFFFVLGDLLLDWAVRHPGRAAELLPVVESSWRKCLEIGEQPALAGSVSGRGSYLAAHNLAVLYGELGDTAQASRYRALAAR